MQRLFFCLLCLLGFAPAYSQIFTENFNRANSTTVGNGWTEMETGTPGAQIVSNRLQLGSTTSGREFVQRDVSGLYTTNGITANTGLIVWAFNFRHTRTDPSGFDNTNYGIGFILGKTTNTVTDGSGYSVVIGQSGTTDPIRLASFVNGPDANANFTNIISANDYGNEFLSVKVTYNTITDEWSLFAESNASAFPQSDPTLTSTQIGTATVNTTFTGSGNDLKYYGAFWNHATGATDNAVFDDLSISILPVTYYPRTTATDLSQPAQWTTDPAGNSGTSASDFISANQLFNLNNNVSNPTVSNPWLISNGSNLILNNSASLLFTSAASFTVGANASADFNNKPVTFKSDATGTAFLGSVTGILQNANNVTVERYISSAANRAYRLLAPSVNALTSIYANWQENGNNAAGLGTHITGSTTGANGFDASQTGQGSLFVYDPATPAWEYISNTNATNLDAKKGYLLYVRGDRTIDLDAALPLPSNQTTLRATGTLLTGSQTFAGLNGNSDFSLITNPYAAAVNWKSIYENPASTGLSQFYTLWDPNIGAQGGYVTVDPDGIKSNPSSNATANIQSGQAFFVQASDVAAPVVNMLETNKSSVNNIDVFRLGAQTELFTSSLFYTDPLNNRVNADAVTSVFNNNYSAALDGNDAAQIANWDEDIAIARTTNELSIERRPLIDVRDTIPFTIARLKVQTYEWQFSAANFNHPDLQASLVDRFLNIRTPISLNGTTVISFTVTSNPASSAADRFMVVFGPNNALPVNFSSVRAYQKGTDIQVEWIVQADANTESYEVEKSATGQQFAKASAVAARSNNQFNYNWLDVNPVTGINYYRIKTISKTGEIQYSKIVRVDIGKLAAKVVVYPNPSIDNMVSLQLNLPKGKYTITLSNKIGQQVLRQQMEHNGGAATQTLLLSANLAPGVYQLMVSDGENNYVQQLVKQ